MTISQPVRHRDVVRRRRAVRHVHRQQLRLVPRDSVRRREQLCAVERKAPQKWVLGGSMESVWLVLLLPSRARSDSYDRVQVPRVRCVSALQSACSVSRRAYVRTRRRARSTRRRSGGGLRTPAASSLKRKRSSTDGRSANACTRRPRRQTRTRKGSWPPSRSRRSGLARGAHRFAWPLGGHTPFC